MIQNEFSHERKILLKINTLGLEIVKQFILYGGNEFKEEEVWLWVKVEKEKYTNIKGGIEEGLK